MEIPVRSIYIVMSSDNNIHPSLEALLWVPAWPFSDVIFHTFDNRIHRSRESVAEKGALWVALNRLSPPAFPSLCSISPQLQLDEIIIINVLPGV